MCQFGEPSNLERDLNKICSPSARRQASYSRRARPDLNQGPTDLLWMIWFVVCVLVVCPVAARMFEGMKIRQRGDLSPCGQSPMDFESITLATRSHCHVHQIWRNCPILCMIWFVVCVLVVCPVATRLFEGIKIRQRGDLNPCGQSPMDF